MISAKLSDIAKFLNTELLGKDFQVSQVFTDSRSERCEGLFVALRGPHFDAHNYLSQVVNKGTNALLVEKHSALPVSQIVVENSRLALGDLARFNRKRLPAKFVAITGSSGKTTVKEMLAAILQQVAKTHATEGNFNNEIGVPLTLLAMDETSEFAVIEMGANHAGEIAYTASITQPHVALINNVAAAHLEGFGDLQGVARAKGEIYTALEASGIAIINNDDYFADYWKKQIKSKMITFGIENDADVSATKIHLNESHCANFELIFSLQKIHIQLPLAGVHNVNNALAAASCAIALGIDLKTIKTGLAASPIVAGRLVAEKLSNGCLIIDDTYNANLESMNVAINLLKGYPNKRILVFGDMAELGSFGRDCHEQIGEFANQAKIDKIYSCGVLTQFTQKIFTGHGQHFSSQQELIQQLKKEANADTTILVKGSRSAHMEKIVSALKAFSKPENKSIASNEGEK